MSDKRRRFEAEVLPHLDAVYRYARWLSQSPGDADDVVQEAILRAYRGFETLRGSDVKAWLFTIVRNCHFTAIKQERRRAYVPLPDEHDVQDCRTMIAPALLPAHLIDVASTDQHTVKPWFAGHADVSPVVADFAPQGYRLIGGRADYFDHQRAAVIVYQHGAHVINVFSWAKDKRSIPQNTTRDGYHLAFWQAGDLEYCAVSDTGWDELLRLVGLLRDLNARSE